jgi:hypothetical protein
MNESNTNNMRYWKKAGGSLRVLAGLALLATFAPFASANDNRAPEVLPEISVDTTTNKVHFVGHAIGFQIYTWNGTSWGNAVPDATLYDDDGNVVATHFGTPNGPAWRSNSGSQVVGKLPPARVTVDQTAIQWLRLDAGSTQGPGIFANTTFIQRVHTVGGLAPFDPGTQIGQVAPVPYTADYFFYRHSND